MTDNAPIRILVGLDGSALAEAILPTVRDLARRLGGEITLLHVIHVPMAVPTRGEAGLDDVVAAEERDAGAYLRRIAHTLEAADVAVRTAVTVGETVPEIVRVAAHERVAMVALATHGRTGIARWLYGSIADGVLHHVGCPLLLLRPQPDAASAIIRRVVVALDGSPLAEEALGPARVLARGLATPLVLLRVVDPLPPAFASAPYSAAAFGHILEGLEADARAYLDEVAARERAAGVAVEVSVATGAPAEVLVREAQTHPEDVLVLTTHGRSGWRAAVIGSVARRVALLTGGPVLMVRPAAR